MSLTREECEKALGNIKQSVQGNINILVKSLSTIEQLIKERFDNQTLTLEELEPDDVVWNKEINDYIVIDSITQTTADNYYIYFWRFGDSDLYKMQFEEHCFYRKQVEE